MHHARGALLALLVLAGLLSLAAAGARAQLPGLPGAAKPAPAPAPDPAARKAEVEALIRTLEDEQARARLLEQLRGLAAAGPAPTTDGPITSALDRLGDAAGDRARTVSAAVFDLAASAGAVPQLAAWLRAQLGDEVSRVVWWSVLSGAGLAAALGYGASLALRFLLRGWRARHAGPPSVPSVGARLAVASARLLVDLAALLAFTAVTYAALRWLEVTLLARIVARDVLVGVALARGLTALARAVLSADNPPARLVPLTDDQATATRRWLGLVIGLAVYGQAALAAALRLGLPWTVHGFLLHLLFLVVTVLVVAAIIRSRTYVAALVRGLAASLASGRDGQGGRLHRLIPWRFLTNAGPYLLSAWVTLTYLVWVLRIPGGTALLTRGAVVTILALAALRALHVILDRRALARPGPAAAASTGDDAPALAAVETDQAPAAEPSDTSAGRTLAVAGIRAGAGLVAAGLVLQAWGVDVADWLNSRAGREVAAGVVRVGLVAGAAGLFWYGADRAAKRYITATDEEGNLVHTNRTRTLANILRNLALTVAVFVVAGHLLAELGVNPAALLAGAGVVGFAIGFGSQKLVQDLTTGVFILLGDTIRVGDVVRLGDRSGLVEAVSMRSVALRDYNGDVHTIPYSSISIVTNMTKDYSYAVFNVVVGYGEDAERVIDLLREIDAGLRREWPYRRLMLEPLDVAGVDAFTDRGVTIMARSKTRAGEQWKVLREFNRRLKARFDELGIDFPYTGQTLHVADPRPEAGQARSFPRPEVVRADAARGAAGA